MINDSLAGPRERLLKAADELLDSASIRSTGVDAIVRQSGAARKSFYRSFRSKDDLIAEVLRRRSERWIAWFETSTLACNGSAAEQLLWMFDVLNEWIFSDNFHGCALLSAAGEIKDSGHEITLIVRGHTNRILDFIERLCAATNVRNARSLARQLLLLMDGAIVVALVEGAANAAADAKEAARRLLGVA